MSITNLYFRPFDKARLDRLTEAIISENLSAALISESEGLLDHYGKILVQRLRGSAGINVEVYYPNSTEALLARFNKILEKISVDSATRTRNSTAPQRVLVAFDSQATGLREIQLMARLVRDFPGANTRVILLLDKKSSTQVEKKIEAFGNKIVRWDIATPTQTEASVLLSESELTGMEPEVRKALENVGVSLDAKLALAASNRAINKAEEAMERNSDVDEDKNDSLNDKNEEEKIDDRIVVKKNTSTETPEKKTENLSQDQNQYPEQNKAENTRKNIFIAFVAASFLFSVSAISIIYLQNAKLLPVNTVIEKAREWFFGIKPSQNPVLSEENIQFDSSLKKPELTQNEFSLLPNDLEMTANKTGLTSEQLEKGLTVFEDAENKNTENEIANISKESNKITQGIKPGFYVQHTARSEIQSVKKIQRSFPSLSSSFILKLKKTRSDDFFFVLLSGPFQSLDDAKTFTEREDIPEGTWIRGALSIRPLIVPID